MYTTPKVAAEKYRSFIPSSLRPSVVGGRINVTNIQFWPEFWHLFSNLDITFIRDFSMRQKLVLQISYFSDAFFDDRTKELVKVLRDVSI